MGQPPTRGCDPRLTGSPVGGWVLRLGKAKSLVAVMFSETRCLATCLRIIPGDGWCEHQSERLLYARVALIQLTLAW